MTFNIGHIENGTDAGWRRVNQAHTAPWTCGCDKEQAAYLKNCPECGATNPSVT